MNNITLDKTEQLLEILNDFSKLFQPDDKTIASTYEKLKIIYKDEDFRHSYAVLSSFCEEITADSREELVANLDSVLLYADKNFGIQDKNIIKKIGKLADHLELEKIRLSRIEHIKIIEQKILIEKKTIESLVSSNEDRVLQQQKTIDNINAQMVSVLGIFSAVVIAFFGGMSYFTSVFSNINESPIYVSLMIASVLGIVIVNTIYLLLKYILVIFNKNRVLNIGTIYKTVNIFLLFVFLSSLIMWNFDYRPEAKHNKCINSSYYIEKIH